MFVLFIFQSVTVVAYCLLVLFYKFVHCGNLFLCCRKKISFSKCWLHKILYCYRYIRSVFFCKSWCLGTVVTDFASPWSAGILTYIDHGNCQEALPPYGNNGNLETSELLRALLVTQVEVDEVAQTLERGTWLSEWTHAQCKKTYRKSAIKKPTMHIVAGDVSNCCFDCKVKVCTRFYLVNLLFRDWSQGWLFTVYTPNRRVIWT